MADRTVLVVDADASLCDGVRGALPEGAYTCVFAATAAEAVRLAAQRGFDVALVDLETPDGGGRNPISQLKHACPGCVVLAMTARPSVETAVAAFRQGSDHFIAKPFSPEDVLRYVEEATETAGLRAGFSIKEPPHDKRDEAEAFRLMAEHACEWEYWLDPEGHCLYVSQACQRVTGYPPEEFLKQPFFLERIVHPDDRAALAKHHREDTGGDDATSLELRITTRNGEERWIAHVCRSAYSEDGRWLGRRATNRDITAEKRAQAQAAHQARLIEDVSEAIVSTDRELVILTWNKAAEHIYGWTAEEALGQPLQAFTDMQFPEQARESVAAALRQEGAWRGEVTQSHKNGSRLNVLMSATMLHDAQGERAGYATILRDITPQRAAEDALRTSEQRQRLLVEQLPALLWTTDTELRLTSASGSSFTHHQEITPDRIGMPLAEVLHLQDPDDSPIPEHRRALRGEPVRYETEWGEHIYSAYLEPLLDAGGAVTGCIGIALEVTESRRAERAARESEARFRGMLERSRDVAYKLLLGSGQYEYVSPSAEAHLGIKAEEMMAMGAASFWERTHPDDRQRIAEAYSASQLTGQGDPAPPVLEYRIRRDDGTYRWIEDLVSVLHDEEGRAIAEIGSLRDVTEDKQARDALKREKEFSEYVIRTAFAAIATSDRDGRVLSFNRHAEEVTGYSAEEVVGRNWPDIFIEEEHRKEARGVLSRIFDSGGVSTITNRIVCKDGSKRLFSWRNALMQGEDDQPLGVIGIGYDITERREAERALRRSEERFRAQYESHPIPMLTWRHAGEQFVLVDFNRAAAEMTQGKIVAAVGKRVDEVYADVPDIVTDVAACFAQKETIRREMTYRRRGAEESIFAVFTYAFVPPDLVMMHTEDITQRKRAQEEIVKTGRRLRQVMDLVPHYVYAKDGEGRFILANEAFAAAYGLTPKQIVGRRHRDVAPDADEIQKMDREEAEVVRTGRPRYKGEDRFLDTNGTLHWLQTTRVPFDHDGDRAVLIVSVDVTEQMQAEMERKRMEEQMQQAQKLESLGVLAGGVAHDFNNLLMGVLGNADLALLAMPPDAAGRDNLREIEKAAQRAAELASQMLAYSGHGKFVIEALNLSALVEDMAHLLEVSVAKKVVLRYNFAPDLASVKGDAAQLRQVVMNLITNASEAIDAQGGIVSVSTGMVEVDESELAATYIDDKLPAGEYVYLEVSDTGSGMDAETVERIFDPFFSTKFTGRGLGLAAAVGIVRGHQGALKVDSEPGKGTTFRIMFPSTGTPTRKELRESEESPPWCGSGTILLVDDEYSVRDICKRILERVGFTVLTARDGREAVETFKEHVDEIACVLLDLTMPLMDGEEAFHALRAIRRDARIILSSGYTEQEAVERLSGQGLAGFIHKPYRLKLLTDVLSAVLDPKPDEEQHTPPLLRTHGLRMQVFDLARRQRHVVDTDIVEKATHEIGVVGNTIAADEQRGRTGFGAAGDVFSSRQRTVQVDAHLAGSVGGDDVDPLAGRWISRVQRVDAGKVEPHLAVENLQEVPRLLPRSLADENGHPFEIVHPHPDAQRKGMRGIPLRLCGQLGPPAPAQGKTALGQLGQAGQEGVVVEGQPQLGLERFGGSDDADASGRRAYASVGGDRGDGVGVGLAGDDFVGSFQVVAEIGVDGDAFHDFVTFTISGDGVLGGIGRIALPTQDDAVGAGCRVDAGGRGRQGQLGDGHENLGRGLLSRGHVARFDAIRGVGGRWGRRVDAPAVADRREWFAVAGNGVDFGGPGVPLEPHTPAIGIDPGTHVNRCHGCGHRGAREGTLAGDEGVSGGRGGREPLGPAEARTPGTGHFDTVFEGSPRQHRFGELQGEGGVADAFEGHLVEMPFAEKTRLDDRLDAFLPPRGHAGHDDPIGKHEQHGRLAIRFGKSREILEGLRVESAAALNVGPSLGIHRREHAQLAFVPHPARIGQEGLTEFRSANQFEGLLLCAFADEFVQPPAGFEHRRGVVVEQHVLDLGDEVFQGRLRRGRRFSLAVSAQTPLDDTGKTGADGADFLKQALDKGRGLAGALAQLVSDGN